MQVSIRRAPLPHDERSGGNTRPSTASSAAAELAHQYGAAKLRLSAIAQPPPIYESFAGKVISPRRSVETAPNPIYEERALNGAVMARCEDLHALRLLYGCDTVRTLC